IVVRGRVTDKATGWPVPGIVGAYAFRDNPHLREYPGYEESYPPHVSLDNDGRYEVVALPGRGLITCQSDWGRYRPGVGAEAIREKGTVFFTVPRQIGDGDCHVVAEINLDPGSESATVNLQVDPGRTITLHVIDPEGRPIGGTRAMGLGPRDDRDDE